jgi:hypothetical protein
MIQYRKIWQSTARSDRATGIAAICRTFMRSVLTVILSRVGGTIARISQIATAGPMSEIGGFAGLCPASNSCGRCGRYSDQLY